MESLCQIVLYRIKFSSFVFFFYSLCLFTYVYLHLHFFRFFMPGIFMMKLSNRLLQSIPCKGKPKAFRLISVHSIHYNDFSLKYIMFACIVCLSTTTTLSMLGYTTVKPIRVCLRNKQFFKPIVQYAALEQQQNISSSTSQHAVAYYPYKT